MTEIFFWPGLEELYPLSSVIISKVSRYLHMHIYIYMYKYSPNMHIICKYTYMFHLLKSLWAYYMVCKLISSLSMLDYLSLPTSLCSFTKVYRSVQLLPHLHSYLWCLSSKSRNMLVSITRFSEGEIPSRRETVCLNERGSPWDWIGWEFGVYFLFCCILFSSAYVCVSFKEGKTTEGPELQGQTLCL